MEQITYTKTYQEYKAELDTELSKTAEGFVRIGYLLKVARDTEILAESGYTTVTEFAKAEYGIDKTMVSRFISINDRFSEGGYSDQLQEQFKGYGYAKLTLMLTLPDEINAQLSPDYSKSDIQAIKDEVDAEKNISDLEVMMETPPMSEGSGTSGEDTLLNMLIRQLGEDCPELYIQMALFVVLEGAKWIQAAKETMAPNGEKQYSIRISGIGRYLVSIRDTEDTITATSLRTMEQHIYDYQDLMEAWEAILPPGNGKMDTAWTEEERMMSWELTYDRKYPGKAEVAPVQPSGTPKKTESKRKESKVQKAPRPVPPKEEPPRTGPAVPPEEKKTSVEEPEKPESTGTEAAGQPPQEPETAEQPMQESESAPQEPEGKEQQSQEGKPASLETENPESTGAEEVSEPKIEFAPGMRVRNKVGNPEYPKSIATIIGRHLGFDAWDAMWDGMPVMKVIFDVDKKEFEVVEQDTHQSEKSETTEHQVAENQTDERTAENIPAAGQTIEELDAEWEKRKDTIDMYAQVMTAEGTTMSKNLSLLPARDLRILREELIGMAALIEKELLRRGEEF